MTVAEVIQ